MSSKKIGIIIFLVFSLFPFVKINAETTTGFVPGNIWYSKDPFEDGDKIKIYTVIWNSDTREFSGNVAFYDDTILLGKKSFSVTGKGVKDISIDWTVSPGNHKIFGKIENAKYTLSNGSTESASLKENSTEESARTVNKKVVIQTKDTTTAPSQNEIDKIAIAVKEKTPSMISEPIVSSVNTLEDFRNTTLTTVDTKKNKVDLEIKNISGTESTKVPASPKTETNNISKPFKVAELFFLKIASFIFNNRIVFYGLLFLILFYMVRRIFYMFVD